MNVPCDGCWEFMGVDDMGMEFRKIGCWFIVNLIWYLLADNHFGD